MRNGFVGSRSQARNVWRHGKGDDPQREALTTMLDELREIRSEVGRIRTTESAPPSAKGEPHNMRVLQAAIDLLNNQAVPSSTKPLGNGQHAISDVELFGGAFECGWNTGVYVGGTSNRLAHIRVQNPPANIPANIGGSVSF
jgi:hypothetical protein